ncbi:MAG: ATP synthase F1 subunit gamma [Candidatus Magasanikbacteria bacterium]|nr:ATP synthase F1 subunit gamma [Candidatus Magasanikbacteria bacterium]
MLVNAKTIRRRIKSVNNTKKITKAMELVAAAKMRRAVKAALATRSYALLAREMLTTLSQMKQLVRHPLLQVRAVRNLLLIVVSSNRGLCGGFNSNVYKKVLEQTKNIEQVAVQRSFGRKIVPLPDRKINLAAVTIGRKSERIMKKMNIKIVASFNNFSDTPKLAEVLPIAKIIKEEFIKRNFEKVAVIYTDYVSAVKQKSTIKQILPISSVDLEKMLRSLGDRSFEKEEIEDKELWFFFEPNPKKILEEMLPRLLEVQLYQALLESSASEHSARMLVMRNASEASEEMIGDLVFTLNQARQAGITREIAEIAGGAAALE